MSVGVGGWGGDGGGGRETEVTSFVGLIKTGMDTRGVGKQSQRA